MVEGSFLCVCGFKGLYFTLDRRESRAERWEDLQQSVTGLESKLQPLHMDGPLNQVGYLAAGRYYIAAVCNL